MKNVASTDPYIPPREERAPSRALAASARCATRIEEVAPAYADTAIQVSDWALQGAWAPIVETLTAASHQRRLDPLLGLPVGGRILAAALLTSLASSRRAEAAALPADHLAALGLAALRARDEVATAVWTGLEGAELEGTLRRHGGLVRQAARHAPLLRVLLAPLAPAQKAALFYRQAAPVAGALIGQLAARPETAALLVELVDLHLAHAGPGAARELVDRAPALLVGGRSSAEMVALAARLRSAAGLGRRSRTAAGDG